MRIKVSVIQARLKAASREGSTKVVQGNAGGWYWAVHEVGAVQNKAA